MPTARQSDLVSCPTYLPPLSPSAESHPHHATGVPAFESYSVKLSAGMVDALLNNEEASIEFLEEEQGKIYIPNRPDVTFTTRAITAHDSETARSTLYSRRGNNLRLVGPINHEMEIDRFPNKRSHPTKKRVAAPRAAPTPKREPNEPNELKELNEPDAASDSAKAPRARKATEKRPRAAPRRPPANPPAAPQKPNGSNAGIRIRSVPALRSAPASPVENGRPAKRAAPPSRNAPGSLAPRRFSPPSAAPLSKPARQQTPTKPSRLSPHSNSRGPSPNVHSPSSPRVSTRRKMDDPEDVRRHLVHSLALGDMTMTAIRRRHEACNMESTVLDEVLGEVAEKSGSTYRLKKRSWREVYDDYTNYSEGDRKDMKQNRVKVSDLVDGKLPVEVMNDDLLHEEVSAFKFMTKTVREVQGDAEDDKLRKNYDQVHRLYSEVIDRMSDVNAKFQRLGDKLETCGDSERAQVSAVIQSANKTHAERFQRFQRVLPKMHGYLKQVRQAVEEYEQWSD